VLYKVLTNSFVLRYKILKI